MTDNPLYAQLDTPAPKTEPIPDFWQVVTDILDNPFIQPCERDGALLKCGYEVIQVNAVR